MTEPKLHDVTESICRMCGRWLLLGTPPAPLDAQICPVCRLAMLPDHDHHDQHGGDHA